VSTFFKSFLRKVRLYLYVTRASGIVRRYFILNGFDGAITIFGIVLGTLVVRVTSPEIIVAAGLGACLAMGISGFFGAYMAEKAERERLLRDMEKATRNNVDPIHYEASRFIIFYVAIVDGISPILTAVVPLIPFILALKGLLPINQAFMFSLPLALATLFMLGYLLGRLTRGNAWLYAIKMLAVGMLTAIIIFILQLYSTL